MPKLNVNDATREQLVETAGLRPAVADALLEYRAKHGGKIASPEALGELPGVGPATSTSSATCSTSATRGAERREGRQRQRQGRP